MNEESKEPLKINDILEDEEVLKEFKKLKKIFKNIDENKKNLVITLIENASFMAVELKKLEVYINENGVVEEYQNGREQWGTKLSTQASCYNTMIKNYTAIIKQLCDLSPDGLPTSKAGNQLMGFITKPKR